MFSTAFLGWQHEEQLRQIVKGILEGKTDFRTIDDLTQGDLEWIKNELREAGVEAELTLN